MTREPKEQSDPAATAELDVDPYVGRLLAERYRVEAVLGSGAMGVVYLAEHVHMKKLVALKVLHQELTLQPEMVKRFEREAIAGARIQHPHVASASDFGRLEDGGFYLALGYVQGRRLSEVLAGERLTLARVLDIAAQIADALHAAHAANVIHRDLKPDNVMLSGADENFATVLDFGIAKFNAEEFSGPALTRLGTIFGTVEYMAPEQARGGVIDTRADLYALGILIYEMLSGKTPFHSEELVVTLTQQLTAEPPPLPESVPAKVRALVGELLAKEPAERPASAELVRERLTQLAAGLVSAETAERRPSSASTGVSLAAAASQTPSQPSVTRRLGVQVAVGAGVFGLLVTWLLAGGQGANSSFPAAIVSSLPALASAAPVDSTALAVRAEQGDAQALQSLSASREPSELLAAARGLAKSGKFAESLEKYTALLGKQPELTRDPRLLLDVRAAARESAHLEQALKLAAKLGAPGLDLIYDVWLETRKLADKSPLARELLDKPALRAQASGALAITLELQAARTCSAFRDLLGRAQEHADQRALSSLRKLQVRRGCGLFGLGDCFSCLRTSNALQLAVEAAAARPAPRFGTKPAPAASSG